MNTSILRIASVILLLAVILGAFAAHGLQSIVEAKQIKTFETGVRYQFYHGFALLAVGILSQWFRSKFINWATYAFILGILMFSGSLYLLACREVLGIASWTWLGPITPIGGTFFIAGWVLLFLGLNKQQVN